MSALIGHIEQSKYFGFPRDLFNQSFEMPLIILPAGFASLK